MNGKSTGLLQVAVLMKRGTTRRIIAINGKTMSDERKYKNNMQRTINVQNIYSILTNGENETIEFKRTIHNITILGKIISAFANANGGNIIIGYDEQYKKIIGISETEQQKIKSFIERLNIQNLCTVYSFAIEDKTLLIIEVQKADDILQLYNGEAYIRMSDTSTRLMNTTDIKKYYASMPATTANVDALVNQITSIYDLLIEQKNASETAERKNFFLNLGFCILSAIIGYLLGVFF